MARLISLMIVVYIREKRKALGNGLFPLPHQAITLTKNICCYSTKDKKLLTNPTFSRPNYPIHHIIMKKWTSNTIHSL
jgi:hypothetical protein